MNHNSSIFFLKYTYKRAGCKVISPAEKEFIAGIKTTQKVQRPEKLAELVNEPG